MANKVNLTTPVDFRVKEGVGTFWIAIEIGGDNLPREMNDAIMSIKPRPGVTFRRVEEIAEILRDNFVEFHYQHPIQQ